MKGAECSLLIFMEGRRKRFVIPIYQRNYDWKREQCKQLFDDLVKVVTLGRKQHFFGSIVSVCDSTGVDTTHVVVDGQQRLTTVSLLLLAMCHLIQRRVVTAKEQRLAEMIFEDYLIDSYQSDDSRIKLKPVKGDREALACLFSKTQEGCESSTLTTNYRYFYERIQKDNISVDDLFVAISKLQIVNITLDHEDSPQAIFESLNSTGLALSEGDKIRNYLLMGLNTEAQEYYYEHYWRLIEASTDNNVSAFIRDYLCLKQQKIVSQQKIYATFKGYVEAHEMIISEVFFKDLLVYARRYQKLLKGGTGSVIIDECIQRLNWLETTVTRPFFLEVLRAREEGALSLEEMVAVFQITESYLFRRIICEFPTNVLNGLFASLNGEICRYLKEKTSYFEAFKYALLMRQGVAKFPENKEFQEAFKSRQMYLMAKKNRTYLLERLENWGTRETIQVYHNANYSIEHILPQTLTDDWRKALGENADEIHQTWLHRVANLTLTAYNSQYSNFTFEKKKSGENGFEKSGFRLNIAISKYKQWTERELIDRNEHLAQRALQIWSYPVTSFTSQKEEREVISLADEENLTGLAIAKFIYKGGETSVTNWREMFETVLHILYEEDPSVIKELAQQGKAPFALTQDTLRSPVRFSDGIYLELNYSTESKCNILESLFERYGIPREELSFVLRKTDAKINHHPHADRQRRYWEMALTHINQQTDKEGAFAKITPSSRHSIDGHNNMRGYQLSCYITRKEAGMMLYLHDDKENKGKRAFDAIYQHRDAIEAALELPGELDWDRGNGRVHSKVVIRLKNISLDKEDDWETVAHFHARWAKKFQDVFLQYLP